MGGRGSKGRMGGGGGGGRINQNIESLEERLIASGQYVGAREVERQIEDELNRFLAEGEEDARVDSFRIISNPGDGRMGDVEAEYHVDLRIPVGRDPETGDMEYEYETEYRTDTFQVVLRRDSR